VRLVGSDRALTSIQVNEGKVIPRHKDGTFHVDGVNARSLVKSGDFAVAGITFRNALGYVCTCGCKFVSLYRNSCAKCECTELLPEEQ